METYIRRFRFCFYKGRKISLKRFCGFWILVPALLLSSAFAQGAENAKHIFLFIGDGMGLAQIQCAEAYLTTVNGGSAMRAADLLKPENRLNMSKMAVLGLQTTFDETSLITDSASAATAFACGIKTKGATIGISGNYSRKFKSIAQLAKEKGKAVGIISSVSLDHATPAAFYASVPNRNLMNEIGFQMAASGYEFFGGGGLSSPETSGISGNSANDVWAQLKANGYSIVRGKAETESLKTKPAAKVFCINPILKEQGSMPYAIDREQGGFSLGEIVETAIATLEKIPERNGFFLMVEGGKIDWACHANDARTMIEEILDFDRAVGAALDFQRRHPKDTIIVVTGDHETGGLSIGHAFTGYMVQFERLLGQKCSFQKFNSEIWPAHEAAYEKEYDWKKSNLNGGDSGAVAFIGLMSKYFGLDFKELSDYQKQRLENAYDLSMAEMNSNTSDENAYFYGGNEPITITITRILNERSGIGWTSFYHTGAPVPVFAQGPDAQLFSGFYDNTEIARKLASILGVEQSLPVEK